MQRTKRLLAILATLALLVGITGPVQATADLNNGVTPPPQCSTELAAPYAALEEETTRSPGKSETKVYEFTVKANEAQLQIVNNGVIELDVAVNGQRLHLNPLFEKGKGNVCLDLKDLIQYGSNTLEVQSLGTPNASAKLTVNAPAFTARILHTNDIHAKLDPLPKMAAYVKAAKAQGGNVYFIDAGDNFSGNPVSDLNQGVPMIEVLNMMGVDLNAVGNHDFDHGPAQTQVLRGMSNFPWLSANTVVANPSATPIQPFEDYKIFTNDLGQKIGFIGLTQTPPATGTKNIVGLAFEDPVVHAQRLIAELRDQVNVLVVVSHNGHDWDTANAPALQGADLIIGGHTHTYLSKPAVVVGIPIMQVGSGGQHVGNLTVTQTGSVAVSGAAVDVTKLTAVDPEVQAKVTAWKDLMAPILDTVIGTTPTKLFNDSSKSANDIGLGSLISDGLAWYMDADMGVWNNGGIRADLPAGNITMNHVYTVLPFGNIPWKVELTGAEMVDFLSRSFARRNNIDLQIGGASYTVFTKPDGSLDRLDLKVGGQPVDLNRTYTLAVSDYIATSASYWSAPPNVVEMGSEVDAIAVAEFIKFKGTLTYISGSAGRIKMKASPTPVPVTKLNFYNSSSLLAAGEGATLVPLTNQAEVLVKAELSAYQEERNATAPKNFTKIDAGSPIPLAAMETVGSGKVVGMGAIMVANGYRTNYQNPQWFTNLMDMLTGTAGGTIMFDEVNGQYYDNTRLTQINGFLTDRGYRVAFTGKTGALTADKLQGVKVFVITTPGSFGAYSADELAVLQAYVAGGGNVILASQTDYNNNSAPAELNRIAAAIGTAIRFNSDEVRDSASNDGGTIYSPLTNEFNANYPDLLKAR